MNIFEKLSAIQQELKAPKNQFNKFGGYNYRNCEDILEAAKPICAKSKTVLVISDEIVNIGERFYTKATATLFDCEKDGDKLEACAYAREEESKKGMDGSQVTGSASSYARKYALNGLFNIDDTKDADFNNGQEPPKKDDKQTEAKKKSEPKERTPLQKEIASLLPKVAKIVDDTPKNAYALALHDLGLNGETEEDQIKIRDYLNGILKNAEA